MGRHLFSQEEVKLLYQTMDWAEALTSEFFRIAPREWAVCRYDVKTRRHLRKAEVTDKGFAQVTRYEGRGSETGSRLAAYYRICFQDQLILDAAYGRQDGILLRPLLLYVGIHELVHVVRFGLLAAPYTAPEEERKEEEMRVMEVSHKIMKRVPLRGLDAVREAYEAERLPALSL